MNWLRLYTDSLDNTKIQSLPGILYKAWGNLLCLCRISRGVLPPINVIAFRLRTTERQAQAWVDELVSRRLIDRNGDVLVMHDWNEHQYESDDAAQRMKRHRKRKRDGIVTFPVTSPVTSPVQECPVPEQIQNRTEQKQREPPNKISTASFEYPVTSAALSSADPTIDKVFAGQIIEACVQAYCSVSDAKFSLTDALIAQAVGVAAEKKSNGRKPGGGLLIRTIPNVITNWAQRGLPISRRDDNPFEVQYDQF